MQGRSISAVRSERLRHHGSVWRVSAGQRIFCGQGQDRTVDLPLFRGSITPEALTWKSPKNPAQAHKGWSTGLSVLFTNVTSVPQSAVASVGFLWGSPPGRGLVGFLWGSQKVPSARKMRHGLGPGAPRSLVTAHARVTERNRILVRLKGHSGAEYLWLEVGPPQARICVQMIQFWHRLCDPMTHPQVGRITVGRSFVSEPCQRAPQPSLRYADRRYP
jgi:hypothetical protein